MPVLANVGGMSIEMNYFDPPPPHFTVSDGPNTAGVKIADFTIVYGSLTPPKLATIRQWAAPRQGKLSSEWINGQTLRPFGKL
jgi:hypothetical protein